jgi:hypothetical protein
MIHAHYMLADGREWKASTSLLTMDQAIMVVSIFTNYKQVHHVVNGTRRFEDEDGNLLLIWEEVKE